MHILQCSQIRRISQNNSLFLIILRTTYNTSYNKMNRTLYVLNDQKYEIQYIQFTKKKNHEHYLLLTIFIIMIHIIFSGK